MKPVVVITGASAGIGRATAIAFARQGASVALIAREPARLRAACREVEAAGGAAMAFPADVADAAAIEDAADEIERSLGPIGVWVNNAMITVFASFEEVPAQEFERVTRVTYLGTVNGTRAALRRMRPRNAGCILQVGSALAYRSIPLQSAYCGAKAAIRGFTDSIRSELIHARCGVEIGMVQLSAFNTPQFDWARSRLPRRLEPVPPIFQPEVAARAIVWLASHPRRELWVGWPAVQAILSARIIPGWGDRLAAKRAWEGQQTCEPAADRPDNLFHPVVGSFGAHGRFDDRARGESWQLWLTTHRYVAWLTAAVVLAFAVAVVFA